MLASSSLHFGWCKIRDMKVSGKTLLGLAAAGVFVILLIGNRQSQVGSGVLSENSSSDGSITAESSSYDFGTISMKDGDVSHSYDLENKSDAPVTLGEIYTSCMCTSAQARYDDGTESKVGGMRGHGAPMYLNRTIQPGENLQVEAVFDPAAHGPSGTGPVNRVVYVRTNSKTQPVVELKFEAEVVR